MEKLKKLLKIVSSTKFLVAAIIVVQILILIVFLNPVGLLNQFSANQLINKISTLTSIPNETPLAMGQLGVNSFPSAEQLKEQDLESAQVYKDALDQDYLVIYSTKMIIFRESENRIIYEGPTPNQIFLENQKDIAEKLIAKAKEQGIISQDSAEAPYLKQITTDLEDLKDVNSAFYNNAAVSDVIAIFVIENKLILYRPSNDSIVGNLDLVQ